MQIMAGQFGADKSGNGSTRANEHGGMERRRRQSKSNEVVGGRLGMDPSEDKGAGRKQVRFYGVEGKLAVEMFMMLF